MELLRNERTSLDRQAQATAASLVLATLSQVVVTLSQAVVILSQAVAMVRLLSPCCREKHY